MSRKYSRSDLMRLAIEEHLKCSEFPRVGVVVAKSGEVLSTGYRGETRGVHAERIAIGKLTNGQVQGSTVFTTLEPCVVLHNDQEIDPCAQLLIDSDTVTPNEIAPIISRNQATGIPVGRSLVVNGIISEKLLSKALDLMVKWRDEIIDREEAIEALRDKIAMLERCRDRGMDPKKY